LGFASVVGAFAGAEVPFERNPNWLRIAANSCFNLLPFGFVADQCHL
jgi:hypothetical protein